jgi:hypothetical protein
MVGVTVLEVVGDPWGRRMLAEKLLYTSNRGYLWLEDDTDKAGSGG